MANGHTIIPLDDSKSGNEALKWLEENDMMVFAPSTLPRGRFPTLSELRNCILNLGYELEEAGDWYVTSNDDHTEIWFIDGKKYENSPSEFWFRRGSLIVLDIIQGLANQCGSFLVIDNSGEWIIVIVPDEVFPFVSEPSAALGFTDVLFRRLPVMLEQLENTSLEMTCFILSQIREGLSATSFESQVELYRIVEAESPVFRRLLSHDDTRIRLMASKILNLI